MYLGVRGTPLPPLLGGKGSGAILGGVRGTGGQGVLRFKGKMSKKDWKGGKGSGNPKKYTALRLAHTHP